MKTKLPGACPKPPRAERKPRQHNSTLPVSVPSDAKTGQRPRFKKVPKVPGGRTLQSSGRIKPKRRSAEDMTRIYGSPARRKWLKAKPCLVCVSLLPMLAFSNRVWRSDIAHTHTAGKGLKADAKHTVPLCRTHHRMYDERLDFLAKPEVRAAVHRAAEDYEAAWQSGQAARARAALGEAQ